MVLKKLPESLEATIVNRKEMLMITKAGHLEKLPTDPTGCLVDPVVAGGSRVVDLPTPLFLKLTLTSTE
jgi:hypothetical protein